MGALSRLEAKFGKAAIPGLLRWVALLQGVMFIITMMRGADVIDFLALDPARILQGQVWRVLSFVCVPPTMNLLFIIFAVFFLWFISDGLESAWQPFGVNLYFFATVFFLVLASFVRYFLQAVLPVMQAPIAPEFVVIASVIIAFACLYPEVEILLFGIIPLKMKWIGFLDVGFLGLMLLSGAWIEVPLALVPFFVTFVPAFFRSASQRAQTATRRVDYERRQLPKGIVFHRCSRCGATDQEEPDLEFRVTQDGEDLCLRCLANGNVSSSAPDQAAPPPPP
ncbi:MAG TPA: hypothetical protein VMN36_02190 [Verrucomicrobiales bacterium]|nr:hypothetical protein [Verrucomicrobiales bacterium]